MSGDSQRDAEDSRHEPSSISSLEAAMAVRRQLLTGGKTLQIKACALSNGFWHLGEFAALYAAQFGEALSTTLARSQQRLS
jgi:AraC family ethanolamine operon transcriptional activator